MGTPWVLHGYSRCTPGGTPAEGPAELPWNHRRNSRGLTAEKPPINNNDFMKRDWRADGWCPKAKTQYVSIAHSLNGGFRNVAIRFWSRVRFPQEANFFRAVLSEGSI